MAACVRKSRVIIRNRIRRSKTRSIPIYFTKGNLISGINISLMRLRYVSIFTHYMKIKILDNQKILKDCLLIAKKLLVSLLFR